MRTIYDEGLAQAAYLIGCQRSGEAIVIDPERDIDRYVELAAENDLRITAVAETHIHADFLSGARELAEATGARVYVSDEGDANWKYGWVGPYEHRLLRDGDRFRVGNIEFEVLHTPGHTPEHISFLVTDHGSGATEPIGIATGDFVFVGDLGRPDLLETAAGHAGTKDPAAHRLYHTVKRLESIPDFVQVWPAHGAGSACGKALGAVPVSTVGYERRFNPAIRAAEDENRFVDFILSGQPDPPLYFARMKAQNKEGPRVLGTLPRPSRLGAEDLATGSFTIVDTRDWDRFRAGHIRGSLSAPLTRSFSTTVGSFIDEDEDIVLIAAETEVEDAVRQLVRVGLDRVVGWAPPEEVEAVARGGIALAEIVSASVASANPLADPEVQLVDVRTKTEFDAGHISGALNAPHARLAVNLDALPLDRPLAVICRTGERSARTAAFLQRRGYEVLDLAGGLAAWDPTLLAEEPKEVA